MKTGRLCSTMPPSSGLRTSRPAGFSNDGPGRGLHNSQPALELRHLGREHGTDRLHCLRSPVGMPLDGGAYLLHVLPGRIDFVCKPLQVCLPNARMSALASCGHARKERRARWEAS